MIYHVAVKIILKIFQTVNIYPGSPAEMKKFFLIIHMMAVKDLYSFAGPHASFPNGNLSLRQFQHISFHLRQELRRDLHISINGIVISGAYGKVEGYLSYPAVSY